MLNKINGVIITRCPICREVLYHSNDRNRRWKRMQYSITVEGFIPFSKITHTACSRLMQLLNSSNRNELGELEGNTLRVFGNKCRKYDIEYTNRTLYIQLANKLYEEKRIRENSLPPNRNKILIQKISMRASGPP